MNQCQRHRGPDSKGYFLETPIGLAHSRLSIVGVETGDQPIENEDGSVVVIFNGEIYNCPKLHEKLRDSGHTFATDTDTEVIVHLYEEYGTDFVTHLEGMFAFALWDRDKEFLTLARDPLGIKPLLFANDGTRIGFASELPSLLESEVEQGSLNQNALSEYFSLGFIPAPKTAFENVTKVRPGELITVSEDGIERDQFYKPSIERVNTSFSTASSTLRDLVTSSVEKRLMSDVPVGTFLSGGIDSTVVTGVLSQIREDPIRTFTVGFENEQFDESDTARAVAQYHNTDHTEYIVSADDVRETIPAVLDNLGEPFADPSLIPTYIVARETSQDVKVALSGDGADELFAGYNRYRGEYYSKFYRTLPKSLRSTLIEPVVNTLPASRSTALGEIWRKGQDFIAADSNDVKKRHFELVRKTSKDATRAYRNCDPMQDGEAVLHREHEKITPRLPKARHDSLARIMAVDAHYGLPNQMLQKVDLASMYNSLEVRVPFLDTDVVEYALGLPTEYKITARNRKRILKHAFEDVIPPEILSKSKQGFEMPIGEWFKNELKADFRSEISQLECSLLDTEAILDVHERHISGKHDYEWFLWNVYVFANWYNRMESEGYLS